MDLPPFRPGVGAGSSGTGIDRLVVDVALGRALQAIDVVLYNPAGAASTDWCGEALRSAAVHLDAVGRLASPGNSAHDAEFGGRGR